MPYDSNPFPESDNDRHALWQMLVHRDIEAFLASDWERVAEDFIADGFIGIDARHSPNPDSWRITFPDLPTYRATWLEQARQWILGGNRERLRRELFEATSLRDIEIHGEVALLHKKFDGALSAADGSRVPLIWQTLYTCRRAEGRWRIAGFTGYLPHPMPAADRYAAASTPKHLPAQARQHATAGPYSPVLEIFPGKLVVISGQAALDPDGKVIGDSIEAQTRHTLANCERQLATAGCALADVFKVNIFMTDLAEWPRVNAVYRDWMPEPRPVRTAVQTGLLMNLKIEIEMWAVKRA